MLKYPCLVLDHDDTVVQSEATIHYPCFEEFTAPAPSIPWQTMSGTAVSCPLWICAESDLV